MDYLSIIRQPITSEMLDFTELFNKAMTHSDGLLQQALDHIRQRSGKRMRPLLILLTAKVFGEVTSVTQHAAVGLELLHTASLVHDDVVDESAERRGQASVNNLYGNKVAVLVGDFILSTALLHVSFTHNETIVPALFEACAAIGALSAGASEEDIENAKCFGRNLGIIFQIRDDIFDYYDQSKIGKPTGNDMAEGKLTLPVIYALNTTHDQEMISLANKVKDGVVTKEEIARLVAFTKAHGGIDYAEKRMWELHAQSKALLDLDVEDGPVKDSLNAYLDYVIERKK